MSKKFTGVHHAASKLNHLIGKRNWRAAFQAADELDTIMAQEAGMNAVRIYQHTTVTRLFDRRTIN